MTRRSHLKSSIVFVLSTISLGAGMALAADPVVTGKWITDTVIQAQEMKDRYKADLKASQPQGPDPFAGPGLGARAGQRAGARARGGGNNFMAPGQEAARGTAKPAAKPAAKPEQEASAKSEEPMAPAVTMDLKIEKTKLTGNIVVIVTNDLNDEKLKVEDGAVDGKKVKFSTYRKINEVSIRIVWEGELTSADRLTLTRKLLSGAPYDKTGPLVFTRIK